MGSIKIRTEDIWLDGDDKINELTVHYYSDAVVEMKKYFENCAEHLKNTDREVDHFGFNIWSETVGPDTFMQIGTVGAETNNFMIMVQGQKPKKILGFIPSTEWLCEVRDSDTDLELAIKYMDEFLQACQRKQHLEYILNFK